MFRTYVSRWRTLRRRPRLEEYAETAAPGDPFADVDTRDALRRALADLPRLQRAVLVLGYLDDMTGGAIAALLDRRPVTVRSLRHRGLRTLRERLAAREPVEVNGGTD